MDAASNANDRNALVATRPRVVLIGAGFSGIHAAKGLHKAPVDLIVIDRNNHHLFQPLLYQVATAGLSPADISAPIRHILKKQKNTTVFMAEVTGVDLQKQRVLTRDRAIAYDYLIVATGASHSYFGHNEWEPYAPGLKTIVDATTIRREILLAFEKAEIESDPQRRRELLTIVLVGGGPTGVEMAGAIAELARKALAHNFRNIDPASARIVLVEAMPKILGAFPESLAKKAQQALQRLGVEVKTNAPVEQIDSEGVVIAGERLTASTVIWTAGVAASPAGRWLGAEVDRAGRVKVNADLSLPGHPNVFVIGDTATLSQGGKPLPGVAPVAMQEGDYVASVIADRVEGKEHPEPFVYHNKGNLATIGRSSGIADLGWLRIWGFPAWFLWLAVHIFFLIGFRNRLLVLIQWAWAYITFQRGVRLITFAPSLEAEEAESKRLQSVEK
jgi:NADH dehydrogenase